MYTTCLHNFCWNYGIHSCQLCRYVCETMHLFLMVVVALAAVAPTQQENTMVTAISQQQQLTAAEVVDAITREAQLASQKTTSASAIATESFPSATALTSVTETSSPSADGNSSPEGVSIVHSELKNELQHQNQSASAAAATVGSGVSVTTMPTYTSTTDSAAPAATTTLPPPPEKPEEVLDSVTKGPAVADRRVQTAEVSDGVVAVPTGGTASESDSQDQQSPTFFASSSGTSTSGPASQSPQSPRNPKYVDIDSVKHPEEPPPEIPSKPFLQNITVRLENLACEHPQHERPGLRIDIEKTFKQLAENISDVQLTDASCKMFLTLNLTVTATDGDFKKLLAKLEEHVKNITVGEHMVITGFTLHDGAEHQVDLMTRPTITRAGRFPTYREELIILVAVIVLLCIVLFIACVICSIRCCRRSPSSKTLDLLEAAQTPRSHSRNVDFNNRIPRAHTLYSPTASEYSGCLSPVTPFGPGVVQPFDTCLVPLDDVTPSGAPRAMGTHGTAGPHVTSRAAPAIRPNNLAIRPRVDFSPERSRFRSYNYPPKHSRTLPSGVGSKNFSKSNTTQSTEQLTKNHSFDDDSGVDNPTYLPTPSTPHVTSDIAETHKI
ncbi:uncharacterized protein LOC111259031 isoform X1 [Varroa jacobsoni]|uniref:uncharacterized protein LOC111259031 isoform X1 n=2 Tax=Varroa jacobsoni TaxID=62625 RepID=UPI000BF68DB5|nr:uncharacterized protein LOC111259031 isoform X1 [Varroa jacobsoni]